MGDGSFLVSTDSRGRISLGKVAKRCKSYTITEEPGGVLILTPEDRTSPNYPPEAP